MQKTIKNKIFAIKLLIIIIGLIAGFAYWYFIGCSTNSCPLNSKWYLSTLYGGLIGYLVSDFIKEKKNIRDNNNNNN